MRVTRVSTDRRCAVCERTLLMGERTFRYSPDGGDGYVDVCQLCQDEALESGWVKEGSPVSPAMGPVRKRNRMTFGGLLGLRPSAETPVAAEPILRRLSEAELEIVEATNHFNASQYRRTVAGVAKSLGTPSVSVVALSGVNADVVITVAWDISWYQYRVTADSAQLVRLAERGHDPAELDGPFTEWNAHLDEEGRVVPDIARL